MIESYYYCVRKHFTKDSTVAKRLMLSFEGFLNKSTEHAKKRKFSTLTNFMAIPHILITVIDVTLRTKPMQPPLSHSLAPPPSASSPARRGTISSTSCQTSVTAKSGLAARLFCCLASHSNNTKVGADCRVYFNYFC